ncbi:hypothetical protein BJ508DRAFT_381575 [Ascobolus immersus RN42]|uniref:Uncharacterized protein n=1 Tax=Ascobolus immersus RN42 TaxID=1160509 RepID=A0A3N4HDP1_ASCIM|nr:hypothetical protein BJ508DRAFT_381575 [Ascobolus immersus RN42]
MPSSFITLPAEIHYEIISYILPPFPKPLCFPGLKNLNDHNARVFLHSISKHRFILPDQFLDILPLLCALETGDDRCTDRLSKTREIYTTAAASLLKKFISTQMIFEQRNRIPGKMAEMRYLWTYTLYAVERELWLELPAFRLHFWRRFFLVWDDNVTFPAPVTTGKGWCECWTIFESSDSRGVMAGCYAECREIPGTLPISSTRSIGLFRTPPDPEVYFVDPDDCFSFTLQQDMSEAEIDLESLVCYNRGPGVISSLSDVAISAVLPRYGGNDGEVLHSQRLDEGLLEVAWGLDLMGPLVRRAARRIGDVTVTNLWREFGRIFDQTLQYCFQEDLDESFGFACASFEHCGGEWRREDYIRLQENILKDAQNYRFLDEV